MAKKIKATCDAGSARVWCGGSYCYFDNGVGDGQFNIYVIERKSPTRINESSRKMNFLNVFYSDGTAKIDDYDCDEPHGDLYTLKVGRYGVYNYNGNVYFVYWDNDK